MRVLRSNPVLAVHDLEGCAAWFAAVLGTENEVVDEGNWIFCRADNLMFMLGHCPDALAACDLGDHSYHSYLHVDDVDAFHERAVAADADVLKAPTDEAWGMRELALRNPEGHRFMLGQDLR